METLLITFLFIKCYNNRCSCQVLYFCPTFSIFIRFLAHLRDFLCFLDPKRLPFKTGKPELSISRRYKVLFLSSWYPNRIEPLQGNFIQRHAEAVSEFSDVASLYVCPDSKLIDKLFDVEIKKEKNVFSVNVYYRKVKSSVPIFSLLTKYFRQRAALTKGFHEIQKYFGTKPDIIHLNVVLPAGFFALRLKKLFNIPFIITEHSTEYHIKMKTRRLLVTKMICSQASLICPVSENLKQTMQECGIENNFEVVPNVVDTNLFRIAETRTKGKKKIIHISTLKEWHKNVRGMLRVIKKLSEIRKDFELHIISDGDISLATEISKEYGLLDKIIFIYPAQTLEKVAEMLRDSDLFLLFSNVETFSCVIIEALASGVPVLSSNAGAIPELVNEKNGMLVNSGDEKALFEKLNEMLDKKGFYNKEELRRFVVDNFCYRVVGKKFCNIYSRFIN